MIGKGQRLILALGMFCVSALLGCSGSTSIPYEAGYAVGSVIDAFFVTPAVTPSVTIQILDQNTSDGTISLQANVSNGQLPYTYKWEQLEGESVTISDADEQVTEIYLPVEADGTFRIRVTATDSTSMTATDEVVLNLNLGS